MQITLTMRDIEKLAKTYLSEMGINHEGKAIDYIFQIGRKNKADSKIIVEVYDSTPQVRKALVEPVLSLEEDTQDDEDTIESSSEDSTQSTNQKALKSKSIFG